MFGPEPLPRTDGAALRDARHPKSAVRVSAARDLARLAALPEGGAAREALLALLARDVSAEVRGAAAVALADAEVRDATEALLAALDDAHLRVRQMALLALGEVASAEEPGVATAVEAALGDPAPAMRFQALIAGHRLDLPVMDSALLQATSDVDAEVRQMAFRLLEERATGPSGDVTLGTSAMGAAREGVDDPVPAVRAAAAVLLARSGDPAGRRALLAALALPESALDLEDELSAIELSSELGLREACPLLERHAWGRFGLGGGRSAYAARTALALLGDTRAERAILADLRAWNRETRTLAVVAAGRAGLTSARDTLQTFQKDPDRADPEAVTEALALLDRTRSPGDVV